MEAALGVAEQGYQAYLVERTPSLGGVAHRLRTTWKGETLPPYVAGPDREGQRPIPDPGLPRHEVKDTPASSAISPPPSASGNGSAPRPSSSTGSPSWPRAARSISPTEYLYGKHPGVLTHLELDEAITQGDARVAAPRPRSSSSAWAPAFRSGPIAARPAAPTAWRAPSRSRR